MFSDEQGTPKKEKEAAKVVCNHLFFFSSSSFYIIFRLAFYDVLLYLRSTFFFFSRFFSFAPSVRLLPFSEWIFFFFFLLRLPCLEIGWLQLGQAENPDRCHVFFFCSHMYIHRQEFASISLYYYASKLMMMFLWALALRPEWKASEFVFSSGIRDCLFQPHMRLKDTQRTRAPPSCLRRLPSDSISSNNAFCCIWLCFFFSFLAR